MSSLSPHYPANFTDLLVTGRALIAELSANSQSLPGIFREVAAKMRNSIAALLTAVLTAVILISFGCTAPSANDAGITTQVQSKLAADSDTGSLKLNVATDGGVVTLSGSAATEIEQDKAEQIAKHTAGVKRVVNHIALNPSSATTPPPATKGQEEKKPSPPSSR